MSRPRGRLYIYIYVMVYCNRYMRHDISYIIELVRYNIIVMTITVYYNIIVYGVGPNSPTCPEKRLWLGNASESIPKINAIASISHTDHMK